MEHRISATELARRLWRSRGSKQQCGVISRLRARNPLPLYANTLEGREVVLAVHEPARLRITFGPVLRARVQRLRPLFDRATPAGTDRGILRHMHLVVGVNVSGTAG